jgi:hypothetical protein
LELHIMTNTTEKRAPVQGYPGGIPWAIHLEAYEVYCKRWGAQPALIDLEGRNCRGGFSTGELDQFIPGWRDRVAEFGLLKTEVVQLRAEVERLKQSRDDWKKVAEQRGDEIQASRPRAQESTLPNIPGLAADPSAFVRWAEPKGYDMTSHPLHFLFLNERTYAAREGWNACKHHYGIDA